MSLPGQLQSQKEMEWEDLMDRVKDFAERWGYDEVEVTRILTRDFKGKNED